MNFSDDQLQELKRLGSAFRSIDKTALIMQLDEVEFRNAIQDKTSPAYKAYYGGREQRITKIMESVNDLAERGSSQAQMMAIDFYKALKIDEA